MKALSWIRIAIGFIRRLFSRRIVCPVCKRQIWRRGIKLRLVVRAGPEILVGIPSQVPDPSVPPAVVHIPCAQAAALLLAMAQKIAGRPVPLEEVLRPCQPASTIAKP